MLTSLTLVSLPSCCRQVWPSTRVLTAVVAAGIMFSAQFAPLAVTPRPAPLDYSAYMCSSSAGDLCRVPAASNATLPAIEQAAAWAAVEAQCGPWWDMSNATSHQRYGELVDTKRETPRPHLPMWAVAIVHLAMLAALEVAAGFPITSTTVQCVVDVHSDLWHNRYQTATTLQNVDGTTQPVVGGGGRGGAAAAAAVAADAADVGVAADVA